MKEDVTISEISGEAGLGKTELSSAIVREVLDTGLFTSRGPNRIGWAHQTYAEFLAARYCKTQEMPQQQIRDLTFHPTGRTKRLIPQLRQLSGWIAVMVPGVLELVGHSDPESLLGTAGTNLSDDQRQTLSRIFLDLSDAGRMLNLRSDLYRLGSADIPRGAGGDLDGPSKSRKAMMGASALDDIMPDNIHAVYPSEVPDLSKLRLIPRAGGPTLEKAKVDVEHEEMFGGI